MTIRLMTQQDFPQFWPTFKTIIDAEETYAFSSSLTEAQAAQIWLDLPAETYVFMIDEQIAGSYYIKPNAAGPGDHVCNCGYMVNPQFRGRGIAAQLCEHSKQRAVELGFQAMQFNSVVSTNTVAVKLWQKAGFNIIGTVPKAYRHKQHGYVDTYVMHQWLTAE
ncbi:MAG: GNAT family N-acetyltransferase [Tolumonas sp.]|nr:GNAT family N-acetyltransferase [Tolumonas sp.]